jgi:Pyruvate/2-oxoacid:ferredoxin oxidoreductase gamma subunit
LGSAGQRIITAGEMLCLAGLHAGLNATQKNDYDITVLRGPSISEMILSPQAIDYTGISRPSVIVALGPEGVARRKKMFTGLDENCTIIQAAGVDIPACRGRVHRVDLKSQGFKSTDWALASLGVLSQLGLVISPQMLEAAIAARLRGDAMGGALEIVHKVKPGGPV